MNSWYFEQDDAAVGPVADTEIRRRLRDDALGSDTLVWSDGFDDWLPLSRTELADARTSDGEKTQSTSSPTDSDDITCHACGEATPAAERFCGDCGTRLPVDGEPYVPAPGGTPTGMSATVAPRAVTSFAYASFGTRVGAYLLDLIGWLAVNLVLGLAVGIAARAGLVDANSLTDDLFSTLSLVALVLYGTVFESSSWQATPGKKLLGLEVVDRDGNRLSGGRAFGRALAKLLSGTILIGFLMVPFTKRRQGLHDLMASTLVLGKH